MEICCACSSLEFVLTCMLSICYCLICFAIIIIIIYATKQITADSKCNSKRKSNKTHDVQLELENYDTVLIFLRLSGCYCDMELQWYCVLYRKVVALSGTSMECRMAALTRYITWYWLLLNPCVHSIVTYFCINGVFHSMNISCILCIKSFNAFHWLWILYYTCI